MSRVEIVPSGCWIARLAKCRKGYAMFSAFGKKHKAHRYSYRIFKGEIPHALTIDHLCSVRDCVNPDHLEAVTLEENIRRGGSIAALDRHRQSQSMEQRKEFMREVQRRGAEMRRSATHCKKGHPYEPDNVIISAKGRACKICTKQTMKMADRRYKEKKRRERQAGGSHPLA